MGEFNHDLDYLVWINVQEESNFQEFLWQHRAEWPEMTDGEARERLQAKLVALLERGSIGVYAEPWANSESPRDLSLCEAKAAVRDGTNWAAADETEWFHHAYPLTRAYRSWPPV